MTIEFRRPNATEEAALRSLFTEAFGDAAFTDLFFRLGFSPDRCLAAFDGEGQNAAYLYGIAAFEGCRGRGVGSALIRAALEQLDCPVLLVPAEESLFGYYERFGFRRVSTIREARIGAGAPLPLRKLTLAEYAEARRRLLPPHSLDQTACLPLLEGYADFYATPHAIAAVSGELVWELLGDASEAPGLIAALGRSAATVRTPGEGRPFAMGIGAEGPIHLGLALD